MRRFVSKMARFSFEREAVWTFLPGLLGILPAGLLYLLRWLLG